jgi:leader peptidase (prepilin peptidase)/N-methyltransferase
MVLGIILHCQQQGKFGTHSGMYMPFETVFYVFALLLGLCIGSFLNVVAWRVPLGRSIVRPGSRCPSCGSDIRWHDNIPVISWLVLGAKCRDCGGRISARYPLTEAATGLLFLAAALFRGPGVPFARDAVFLSLLVVTVRTDLDHWIVLDEVSLGGTAAGLLFSLAPGGAGIVPSAAAALGGFLLFFLIRLVAGMVLKGRPGYAIAPEGHEHEAEEFSAGMGWGDIKLAACIGAFLGPGPTAVAFFLAFLAGALIGGSLILFRGRSRRIPIPFGPFMALGASVSLFFGAAILNWYLDLWGMR